MTSHTTSATSATAHPTSTAPSTADLTARCRTLTSRLSDLTGIAWSFGYIGNVNGYAPGTPAYRDDRSWSAFASHPGRVGDYRDRIGSHATEDLADLVDLLVGAVALARVLDHRSAIVASPYGASEPTGSVAAL